MLFQAVSMMLQAGARAPASPDRAVGSGIPETPLTSSVGGHGKRGGRASRDRERARCRSLSRSVAFREPNASPVPSRRERCVQRTPSDCLVGLILLTLLSMGCFIGYVHFHPNFTSSVSSTNTSSGTDTGLTIDFSKGKNVTYSIPAVRIC